MLCLTEQDCQFFENAMVERFNKEILSSIKRDMPDVPHLTDDAALRAVILHGIKRAEEYGITDRSYVQDYIYLMHTNMGTRFDEDPIHKATQDILNDTNLGEDEKIKRLKDHVKFYTNTLFEKRKRFTLRMIKYLRKGKAFDLKSSPAPFEELKRHIMGEFHDKYALINQSGLDKQIFMVQRDMRELGITSPGSQAVVCMLVFLFGFRVYNDPSLPDVALKFWSKTHTEDQKLQFVSDVLNRKLKAKIAVMKQGLV
jgi:hypothetical protein